MSKKYVMKKQGFKLCRLTILMFLSQTMKIRTKHPLQTVQLLLEKEVLVSEIFFMNLKFNFNIKNFRIPVQLTQEDLPMAFQFYNNLIPSLDSINHQFDCRAAHSTNSVKVVKIRNDQGSKSSGIFGCFSKTKDNRCVTKIGVRYEEKSDPSLTPKNRRNSPTFM